MEEDNSIIVVLPDSLTVADLKKLEAVLEDDPHGAHLEERPAPSRSDYSPFMLGGPPQVKFIIHLPGVGVGEAEMVKRGEALATTICRAVEKCMVCGTGIKYDMLDQKWAHENPKLCRFGAVKMSFPPPDALDEETEERTTELQLPAVKADGIALGTFDMVDRVDRYRAIGEALREAFGVEWLALRGQVRGLGPRQ